MFISILSILMLSQMQAILFLTKINSGRKIQHQDFYQLECFARSLVFLSPEKQLQECLYKRMKQNHLISLLQEKKGCLRFQHKNRYYILAEDLGVFPCLQIVHDLQKEGSRHFRYTVALYKNEQIHSILQLRLIKPQSSSMCTHQAKQINTGISNWRYLDLIR